MRRTASLVAMFVMVLSIMAPAATFASDNDDGGNCPGGEKYDDPSGTIDLGDGVELTVTDSSVTATGGTVELCVKGGNANSGVMTLSDGESYTVDFTNAGGNTPAISNIVVYSVTPTVVTEPEETDVCPNIEGDQAVVPEGFEKVGNACIEVDTGPDETDVCPNIEGDQAVVPEGFEKVGNACVEVDTGPDEVEQQMVTICHATASATNPYNVLTISVNAVIAEGHGGHEGDIIPSFEYTVDGEVRTFPGQNLGDGGEAILDADCVVDTGPDEVDVCPNIEGDQAVVPEGFEKVGNACIEVDTGPDETDVCPNIEGDQAVVPEGFEKVGNACVEVDTGPDEVSGDDVTICHATESDTNPYELITVDVNAIIGGGHGDHEDDIIPSFQYTVNGEVRVFPGQNLTDGDAILADDCVVDTGPDEVDVCPNLTGDQAEVPAGYRLVDGVCVVIEIQCPEGSTLVGDVCVIDAVECPEGATLVDGVCVIDAVECPEGAILVGDVCVIDAVECPEGAELVDDVCVVDVVCPEGSTLTDGECVVDTVVGGVVVDRPDDGDDGDDGGDTVVGGVVVDRPDDDDGDVDAEEVVVVVPSDLDTEVLGVTQTRTGTAQLAATGPATLPLLVLFSLLSLLFGLRLRSYGRTARASK